MATRGETNAVYAAGLIQGIALVTFPAASTIFASPGQYGLSSTQYGTMFLPQVVTATNRGGGVIPPAGVTTAPPWCGSLGARAGDDGRTGTPIRVRPASADT
jgi:hypothetical protein